MISQERWEGKPEMALSLHRLLDSSLLPLVAVCHRVAQAGLSHHTQNGAS